MSRFARRVGQGIHIYLLAILILLNMAEQSLSVFPITEQERPHSIPVQHNEKPSDFNAFVAQHHRASTPVRPQVRVTRGVHESVQVNIDAGGNNIIGDAANEPTIAIDPTAPDRIVIGWRQFDTISSDFRKAGWAFSHDGGETWAFPGVLRPSEFGSDPVLQSDGDGDFFFLGVRDDLLLDLHRSNDGGITWNSPLISRLGSDKPWLAIDQSATSSRGYLYVTAANFAFRRSIDIGTTFTNFRRTGTLFDDSFEWAVPATGPDGEVYAAVTGRSGSNERRLFVFRSDDARLGQPDPTAELIARDVFAGHFAAIDGAPNNAGLLNQPWISVDHSQRRTKGTVYLLCAAGPIGGTDKSDVLFTRSPTGGRSWSIPVRINDDPLGNGAWQWFAMMSIAPNGRIDAVWNDSRASTDYRFAELYYAYSFDEGRTWSLNEPLTPSFSSNIGMPRGQLKLGDYYHMVSTDDAVHVAYAATFNGEQNVYYLRIETFDCNSNGVPDPTEIAMSAPDQNGNFIPDDCEPDCNRNGLPDDLDLSNGILADTNQDWIPDGCAKRIYVDWRASGFEDGSSWEHAFRDLQDALDAADNDAFVTEVWVAAGEYRPDRGTGNRRTSFDLRDHLSIFGGFKAGSSDVNSRNIRAQETILSGDLSENDGEGVFTDNSNNVLKSLGGRGRQRILDGFTITGGLTLLEQPLTSGAGIHAVDRQVLTVRNCTFRDMDSSFVQAVYGENADLRILDSSFFDNGSQVRSRGILSGSNSRMTIEDCLFSGNYGWPVQITNSFADIRGCTIMGNHRQGIQLFDSQALVSNCILWENGRIIPGTVESRQILVSSGSDVAIQYCAIQDWTGIGGGEGNIGLDPQFQLPGSWDDQGTPTDTRDDRWIAGNPRLGRHSPCRNTGDPGVEFVLEDKDLDGHTRVLCDWVDMGAFEFGIGDSNCNGRVETLDHIPWHLCASGPEELFGGSRCQAFDFDADGDVDLIDFKHFQEVVEGQ